MDICEYIAMLNEKIWDKHGVVAIEGGVLITVLSPYPDYSEPITAVCLSKASPIVLIGILTKVPLFNPCIFSRFIQTTGREELVIVSPFVAPECSHIYQLYPILLTHSR
jgi:hypothetical protein